MTLHDDFFEGWVERHRGVTCGEYFADEVMARIQQHSDRGLKERFTHLAGQISRHPFARAGVVAACIALGALRLLLITRVLFG